MKTKTLSLWFMLTTALLAAQPPRQFINIVISPGRSDWTYRTGENVRFNISVSKFGLPVDNVMIEYTTGPEMLPPQKHGEIKLVNGTAIIDGGSMQAPGFLKCEVKLTYNGRTYSEFASAAIDPHSIRPSAELPPDFRDFWDKAKTELSAVPADVKMTLIPGRSNNKINVYHVSIRNINDSRIYGILSVPRGGGTYPAILYVPGAGARPYEGETAMAEMGFITFQIGIHGVPVDFDNEFYQQLMRGPLRNYWTSNLDCRDNYYFKRVYLGCLRAVDYIFTLDEFDGENIAVTGASQGGALSIITASLDRRIKFLASVYPALSDLTGYLHGRAGGWPHMFRDEFTNTPAKIKTSAYYDVVNFARYLEIPGLYTWGFNDNVCPPTSMYAAYNVITASRELFIAQDSRHWTYPEQREMVQQWLINKLAKPAAGF
jgi:cephalosporin-C deacetylase